jgi:hypothetical protein
VYSRDAGVDDDCDPFCYQAAPLVKAAHEGNLDEMRTALGDLVRMLTVPFILSIIRP